MKSFFFASAVFFFSFVAQAQLSVSVAGSQDQYLSYNFGTVGPNRTASTTLSLSNDGDQDLKVEKITLGGIDFSGTSDCPETLKPQEKCFIRLRFWPQLEGYKTGRLSIYTSANDIFVDLYGWCRNGF